LGEPAVSFPLEKEGGGGLRKGRTASFHIEETHVGVGRFQGKDTKEKGAHEKERGFFVFIGESHRSKRRSV